MKRLIGICVIFFALILDTQIGYLLGISLLLYSACLILILYVVINIAINKLRYDKVDVYIILLALIIFLFKLAVGQNFLFIIISFMIVPMLLSICYENFTKKDLTLLFRFIIIFYIAECGLSIVEWVLNRNFFVYQDWLLVVISDWEQYEDLFRSSSLLGHPLSNAQVVAVFMTFIAVSNFKRKDVQIILFFLGYVSLFCFGARGATLVVTTFVVPYFIWKINSTTPSSKKWIIKLAVLCMFFGLGYGITQTSLGDRLLRGELIDNSSQTRIDVFQFRNYQTQDDFLWGRKEAIVYMNEIHNFPVENGVITLLIEYGIILTIPLLILLFLFQYRKLYVYPKFEKLLLLTVFFIIGCMNPNLAYAIQWTMWINAYYAFRHLHTENISNINNNRNFNS